MNNKKKVKIAIVIHSLFFIICSTLLSFFRFNFYYKNSDFSEIIVIGVYLIFFSVVIASLVYISNRYGVILMTPWRHVMQGGEYSWWVEQEIETDIFWRIVILGIVFSVSFLILGIAFIIIPILLA